jgi:hypothetical protein
VIATSEDKHELSWFVFSLGDLEGRVFLDEVVGVEEGSLVSKVFAAFAKMLWEEGLCLSFQNMRLIDRDTVPKLGLALMEEVNG